MSQNFRVTMRSDIISTLSREKKSIPSKYFYDHIGCELFQQITGLDEYYLTRCEKEILSTSIPSILKRVNAGVLDVIEIGPGDGSKAVLISEEMVCQGQAFNFFGLDICEKALDELKQNFQSLESRIGRKIDHGSLVGEFSDVQKLLQKASRNRKLVLFLGSSIGNLPLAEARRFLQEVARGLANDDFLLVGFDLKKDIEILTRAYNDKKGITAKFNLNLLERINRELGADFDASAFFHHEFYDKEIGAMTSFLVSKKDQVVTIDGIKIKFKANEYVHTEYSFKYSEADIKSLVKGIGLRLVDDFRDQRSYFSCALFQKQSELELVERTKADRKLATLIENRNAG